MQASTDTIPGALRPRRVARPLLWVIFTGASLASIIALAADWSWFAELFTHFRLYYLLAQGLLIIAFLNTRRYGWLAVTLLLAAPNAWYVGPYLLPLVTSAGHAAPEREGTQVLTVNLSFRNAEFGKVIDYIEAQQPEVIVLSEYTREWQAALAPALADWPYRAERPRPTPFGMAVYSRQPLRDVEWLDLGVPESENLRVALSNHGVELYAVHLMPPSSPQLAAGRNRQLAALAGLLAKSSRPRLVTGDLNLTPFSPYFSRLLAATDLSDTRRTQGLHVTWPAMPVPVWIPIDHSLADPSAGVLDVRTGPDIGSDHFPLEITLAPAS
ncbi:MAG: endonuclease/exonuclease/phosphatase family protein [Chromatiales bacterium]|nr:MAG: endonuclease/exonuclease/phosphatase family protein [Chromatiales bacterium]